MNTNINNEKEIVEKDLKVLVDKADGLISNTIRNINYELVTMYWSLGKMIAEYKTQNNSKYGDGVVKRLSEELYHKYGSGFSWRNIYDAINLYKLFRKLPPAAKFKNTSWSHYREIVNCKDRKIIDFYLREVENKNLTKLELREYIKSQGYERTISNQRE